jgi:hypothetical protein
MKARISNDEHIIHTHTAKWLVIKASTGRSITEAGDKLFLRADGSYYNLNTGEIINLPDDDVELRTA